MTGRGWRSLLGGFTILVSTALALLNHGLRVTTFTKEELFLNGLLVVAGLAMLSGGGFNDIIEGAAKVIAAWKGRGKE